jgi:hypothetical protein
LIFTNNICTYPTAAMPLVVDEVQEKYLEANLPKTISDMNYKQLPITGNTWFTCQKNNLVIALGGQVSDLQDEGREQC